MTINKYLQQISPEDLAYVKRYHHEIQPFRVLPSSTLEFDGQFNGGGETIFTEINLNEDHTIDDMFCTCGAGSHVHHPFCAVELSHTILALQKMNSALIFP